jgi:hypothetical protein
MARYPLNQPIRVSTTVRDVTGALVDAGTLTLVVKLAAGDGTFTTTGTYASPVHDSTGTYHQDIPVTDLAALGHYQYTWTSTGTGAGVSFGDFDVFGPFEPSVADRSYCTPEELKGRLQIADGTDDDQVGLAVQAAARSIEGYCGRYFWQGTDTRTYVPESPWRQPVDDLVSITTLKTDSSGTGVFDVTWTAGIDFELALGETSYNVSASGEARPYREIRVIGGGAKFFPFTWALSRMDRIQVVGVFGWPAVPPTVKQAALQLASNYFRMKDAPFGVQGMSEFGVVRVQAFPQVTQMLQPYVDPRRKVGV